MQLKTTRMELTSVGVDIGSSTSHVIFSKIVLEKDLESRTEKFKITDRQVIHSGPVHFTPFKDPRTIDYDALRDLLLQDYIDAGIDIARFPANGPTRGEALWPDHCQPLRSG